MEGVVLMLPMEKKAKEEALGGLGLLWFIMCDQHHSIANHTSQLAQHTTETTSS
eukprot:m.1663115 g.1663115  ORF g.1663115 m.1663115 type:complete len:54 (-) comp134542_c0_seq1:45-206(-)